MHFVHVIEINAPHSSHIEALTRKQLWRGLMRRVEQPKEFLPQLVNCLIVVRGDTTMARELNFGSFTVRDRVRLEPMQRITFDTDSAPNISSARLCIAIEQPTESQLQLRFTYNVVRKPSDDPQMEVEYEKFIQSAYVQTDIESVKIMRALLVQEVV